jgi:uncharacterized coiled-coil protein SlyX
MAFLPPAIFEIKAVADKAIAEFKQVNNELGKMEDQSMKAGGSIGKIDKASRVATAGLLAMGAAFAGFAALGIKEAIEAETIMTKLNATLAAQGLNTAKTRAEIDELSSSFVQLGFDDEAAASSMQILIQTTGDLAKSKQLLGMAADLARAKSISLESASQMLVRANMGAGRVFKQFGIVLDQNLPKAEATAKAMQELKEKLSGQAQKATETFSVQLQILKERFNNAAQAVGEVLIPYLKTLFDKINEGIEFVKRNSTAFQIFGGIILTVTVALASYALTLKVITAATKAYAFIQGVAKTATALLTGQQIALNGAMAVNPIGLVVMAVVALIGVLVILWNKSDAFRKGVIAMSKAALNAFAAIIPMVGQVGEAILKFVLTPLKTLLSTLSKLPGVGKYAKAGLDFLNKGLDGVSDFADKAAAKAKTLSAGLDKLNKPIKIKFLETPDIDFGNKAGGAKGGGLTPEQEKAQAAAKEATKKANEDYMKVVKDLQEKVVSAQIKFNEKMQDIDEKHNDKVNKLKANASDKLTQLGDKYREDVQKATNAFNETMGKFNKKRADDEAKLFKDNQDKIAEIAKSGTEKLASIVQQSIDRLRSAFAKGTEFKVGDIFKGLSETGTASAEGLLDALKQKLSAAKNLAENAAFLQANGFSQTFIEQVVSAGPEVGNKLAESILNSSPETMKALQATYLDLESVSENGLNALGATMNTGGKLATDELTKAYADAQKDTADALTKQSKLYQESMAEIAKNFDEAMAEAEKQRDETLKGLAKDYTIAMAEINKDLETALKEAYDDMVDAQTEARKELADTLAAIEKDMVEKLGSITNATNATITAIKALATALTSAKAFTAPTIPLSPTPTNTPYTITEAMKKTGAASEGEYMRESRGLAITQNISYPTASASEISAQTLSAIKFGTTTLPLSQRGARVDI